MILQAPLPVLRPAGLPSGQPAAGALPVLGPAGCILPLGGLERERPGCEKPLPVCAQAMTPGPGGEPQTDGGCATSSSWERLLPGHAEGVAEMPLSHWWAKSGVKQALWTASLPFPTPL